jgi:hypothetical protein
MLALVRDPLSFSRLALVSAAITLAVAIYCAGYSALAGGQETLAESLGWSIVNILPWVPALEAAKRARKLPLAILALIGGLVLSLALDALFYGVMNLPFEAWRRVPAFAVVAAIAIGLRWTNHRGANANQPLPLLPRQIDWIRAAGNYVELRADARTVVHRASLSSVEKELDGHGFIRIHRSLLVRRDRIARIRPEDVVLLDGTHLKIGKRYRADIAA